MIFLEKILIAFKLKLVSKLRALETTTDGPPRKHYRSWCIRIPRATQPREAGVEEMSLKRACQPRGKEQTSLSPVLLVVNSRALCHLNARNYRDTWTQREKEERKKKESRFLLYTHRMIYMRINLSRSASATKCAYLKGIPIKLKMIHSNSVAASFILVKWLRLKRTAVRRRISRDGNFT